MNRHLMPFILARGLGLLADEMFTVAVPVALYTATGDLAWSGLSVMGLAVLRVIFLPSLASHVDRHRMRPQLLAIDAVRLVLAVVVALVTAWHGVMLALAGVLALLNTYGFVILEKTVATHSADADLGKYQARLQSVEQVARVAGPALAGLLLFMGGMPAVAGAAVAIFCVTWCAIWFGFHPAEDKPVPRRPTGMREALRTLWAAPAMVWLVGVSMASNLVESLIMALAPMMFITRFGRTEADLGVFFSVTAAVSILVLTGMSMRKHVHVGRGLALALLGAMAVASLVIPVSPTFLVFAGLYLAFIVMRSVFVIHVRTERARAIPAADFGKVLGVMIALLQLPIPISGLLLSTGTRLGVRIDMLQWVCTGGAIIACAVLALVLRRRQGITPMGAVKAEPSA